MSNQKDGKKPTRSRWATDDDEDEPPQVNNPGISGLTPEQMQALIAAVRLVHIVDMTSTND